MSSDQLRFAVGQGPICVGCPVLDLCGAAELDDACHAGWGDPRRGGVDVLHPRNPATWQYFREVDGADFGTVTARRQPDLTLPAFVHRIRMRRALRGELDDALYVVGPEIAARPRGATTAVRVRELTGLSPSQSVGLLLFGHDRLLESMWGRRFEIVRSIAAAGYAFCSAPSFSNYTHRPRTEYLFNAKRSLVFFELLQRHGIPAIPRVAWLIEHDVRRVAIWISRNPTVQLVALDWSSSSRVHWKRELALLKLFDRLTQERLSYLIHGPSTTDRALDIYRCIGTDRVHLTHSKAIARPALPGTRPRDRFATEHEVINAARRIIEAERTERVAAK